MVSLLIRAFLPKNADLAKTRSVYGFVCGGVGIFLNLLLFVAKLLIGTLSGSISITADAFNNFSDAGSSAMTLFGFLWAGKKPDSKHPFGHGRIEYLCGILISVVIILVGGELLMSSVQKILTPEPFTFNIWVVVVLSLSILTKVYMYFYNNQSGKKIHSETLCAAAADSLGDCIATGAVLVSSIFCKLTDINIDAYVGSAVSLVIMWTGIKSIIETASPLLGRAPDPEFVKDVVRIVRESPATCGIHDMVVHDYGPNKRFVSLHMEVDGSANIYELHDAVDLVEEKIASELGCEVVIHMDPIDISNPTLAMLSMKLHEKATTYDGVTVHDIRMVPGVSHTNVIFDIAMRPETYRDHERIDEEFEAFVHSLSSDYCAVIKSEPSYTEH